jgi:simple sugar transport system ATP-binding protein
MLAAQPTWGVDVGASLLIWQALIDLRNAGAAVLVISEDLDELFAICDCLAVLARGRLSATTPTAGLAVETVGVWMTGEFEPAALAAAVNHAAV